ncbi:cytidylyltransferase domain-containing protein [Tropicibacter naphthalenivorans]|uniref:N-acylneuraminate cytidylyltransferase n=1 Tax=Tropicibacter naphthalenivorans TaxID=441103 RepID=A0A0P1GK73_9RHOB|nr:acylneuraminate cytidylyltransferase family protein [Tropicibacter naphthalenivorans]CUH82399.1 N-acylneuraminate cytidylyltransferase [Tropicibacter naphthalenivorans]SMD05571.1 N-acylneuraminate cytidylyltransferase [Tropicibacter naphthalenivorans]
MSQTGGQDGVLAVITARGGSKGVPRKNVRPLGGVPLIAWTVRAALEASCVARVIVSTDDAEIAEAARDAGADVPFMRPADLASDTATSVDVMVHALEAVPGYDRAVLLQPTSPFRTGADLDAGFALWQASPGAGGCVSVCEAAESPWLMYGSDAAGRLNRLLPEPPNGTRRQDLPKALVLNGAFYFVDVARFLAERRFLFADSLGFEMPVARSVDIDTAADFAEAESLLAHMSEART